MAADDELRRMLDGIEEPGYITITTIDGESVEVRTNLAKNGDIRRLLATTIIWCAEDGHTWDDEERP